MAEPVVRCGKIIERDGARAVVRLEPMPETSACKSCGGCAAQRPADVEVDAPPEARTGDRVQVRLYLPSAAWSAFMLFLIPAALLVLGIAAWEGLGAVGWAAKNPNGGLVLGVVLAGAWYVVVALIERRHRAERRPKLVDWPGREG